MHFSDLLLLVGERVYPLPSASSTRSVVVSAQHLPSQIEVLSADPQIVASQDSDGAWQLEALSAGGPRIEEEHVAPPLEAGLVRMAENDDVRLLPLEQFSHLDTGRPDVEDVAVHELEAAEFEDLDFPKVEITVAVTLDGGDRGDLLEAAQHGIGTDIACVQDVVDAGKEFDRRPQPQYL